MANATASEREARSQVFRLQVGHLVENLRGIQSRREKVKDVADANAHAPDTRTTATLPRVERNAIEQRRHERRLGRWLLRAKRKEVNEGADDRDIVMPPSTGPQGRHRIDSGRLAGGHEAGE